MPGTDRLDVPKTLGKVAVPAADGRAILARDAAEESTHATEARGGLRFRVLCRFLKIRMRDGFTYRFRRGQVLRLDDVHPGAAVRASMTHGQPADGYEPLKATSAPGSGGWHRVSTTAREEGSGSIVLSIPAWEPVD